MLSRRIVIAALIATAVIGVLVGGITGVLGGGGGGKGASSAAATPSTSATSGPPTSAPPSDVPTSAPASTSASATASPTPTATKPALTGGKVYTLTAGGKAMDVYGADRDDNTPIILFQPGAGKTNQQWTVQDAGGGYVYLISRSSNMCLDIRGGKDAHAVQDNCGRDARQQWQPQARGGGVVFVNRQGGQALGAGPQVKGQPGLGLVAPASGLVFSATPVG